MRHLQRPQAEFLRSEDGEIAIESGVHELPFGTLEIRAARPGFPWGPEDFNRFLLAMDYEVRGLQVHNLSPGLGAALIVLRSPAAGSPTARDHLPPRIKVAATAFLRISEGWNALRQGRLAGSLELYAPFNSIEIEVGRRKVPLEADLTAPLAYSIVEYERAHLDEAKSECVIRSGHSCQDNPLVIQEVRRILLEHIEKAPDPEAFRRAAGKSRSP